MPFPVRPRRRCPSGSLATPVTAIVSRRARTPHGPSDQHRHVRCPGHADGLADQPRFADTRFTGHHDTAAVTACRPMHSRPKGRQLRFPAHHDRTHEMAEPGRHPIRDHSRVLPVKDLSGVRQSPSARHAAGCRPIEPRSWAPVCNARSLPGSPTAGRDARTTPPLLQPRLPSCRTPPAAQLTTTNETINQPRGTSNRSDDALGQRFGREDRAVTELKERAVRAGLAVRRRSPTE
jgi:hypothetical protein